MPPGAVKALQQWVLTETVRMVNIRILSIALVVLAFGATPAVTSAADGPGAVRGNSNQAPVADGADSDTTYVARMDPLIVTGYRIDQTYTGTLASAGGETPTLATAAAGGQKRPAADSEDVAPDGVGIGGLTVDETFSVIGARFSQAFNDKWTEPEGVQDLGYTITLGENPAPRLGAQVFVDVEGTTLFRAYLRPNRRQIQQAAQQAVQRATLYLQKYYEPREVY